MAELENNLESTEVEVSEEKQPTDGAQKGDAKPAGSTSVINWEKSNVPSDASRAASLRSCGCHSALTKRLISLINAGGKSKVTADE